MLHIPLIWHLCPPTQGVEHTERHTEKQKQRERERERESDRETEREGERYYLIAHAKVLKVSVWNLLGLGAQCQSRMSRHTKIHPHTNVQPPTLYFGMWRMSFEVRTVFTSEVCGL